jgi:nitrogen fixation/metabolism regulation signal transduction histidine kinase
MTEKKSRFSFEGKLTLIVASLVFVVVLLGGGIQFLTGNLLLSAILTAAIGIPLSVWAIHTFMAPVNRLLQALIGGVSSLRDNDFSISIAETRRDELGDLVLMYNELGGILRDERQELFQRELLLDTVIQSTPLALVLTNSKGAIVYSNSAARKLFMGGRRLEGHSFLDVLQDVPAAIREAVERGRDGLFAVGEDADRETWHMSHREFVLNAQPQQLYLFKHLTREINRQEVATWKKVIRVIGHELNNSLAPISSLAHSGALVLDDPDQERLAEIFATIEERSNHLKSFIDGYARFAKLPQPNIENVDWPEFLRSLKQTVPFEFEGEWPERTGRFDPVQIEQVLINLLKNAQESGSAQADILLQVRSDSHGQIVRVLDRGTGMSEQVLKNALLPFYSTKQTGSGLGLPLCREIIEAHGGRINLANRRNNGLIVELSIPA